MTVTPLRTLMPALLLLLMAGRGTAFDTSGRVSCDMRAYTIWAVVDEVKMKDATLQEAVNCIRAAAVKLTPTKYFNIVVSGQPADPAKRITLDLKQVPLKLVLEEVARTFGLQLRTEYTAIVLASPSSAEPIRTRIYRVPPDFMATGSAAK